MMAIFCVEYLLQETEHIISFKKPEDIPNSFADVLGGLMAVVAQNIVLTITSETVKITKIITKFPHEKKNNESWEVKIPDLFSEESKDILVEIELESSKEPINNELLFFVSATYFNSITKKNSNAIPHSVILSRPEKATLTGSQTNLLVDIQKNRIQCAEALTQARIIADSGKLENARQLLQITIKEIGLSPSCSTEESVALVKDLEQCLLLMKEKSEYHSVGQKKMQMKEQSHHHQRAQEKESTQYQIKEKCAMRSKASQAQSELGEERFARRAAASSSNSSYSSNSNSNSRFQTEVKKESKPRINEEKTKKISSLSSKSSVKQEKPREKKDRK